MKIRKKVFFLYLFLSLSLITLSPSIVKGESAESAAAPSEKANPASDIRSLLVRLEKKISDFQSMQTDFIQEKNLAIFRNRIIIKGRIYIRRPHMIAWLVDEPMKYSVLITDKFIRQWDEDTDRVQETAISGNPVFSVVIDQLTAWFSGKYVRLLDDYNVHVKKNHPLEIEFIPRETAAVKKIIRSISVTFREDERYLSKIHFQEAGGDSTTIIFSNTILNAPIDESVFRIKKRV